MTGGQLIVECLVRHGVDVIFGIPGAHTMAIYDALYEHPKIKHVLVRHEQSAVLMADDSRSAACYGTQQISERHRHRYEFNPEYKHAFVDAGMAVAGASPDGKLVEVVEIPDHPWFVAVQFHP